MVEEQRQRLEQETTKLVNDLDRKYLRQIQRNMHKCAIGCCDDDSLSMERVQQCVNNCSRNLNAANNLVNQEFQHINSGLQRCVMDCNDEIRYKMGANPSSADEEKYTRIFESCASKCVDKFLGIIPVSMKNLSSQLEKLASETKY